ncbi:MAG: HTH domain-containing protein [Paludibacteraceae bacterium]|nr:HTH domain-containing protein [Paludibacteraceae bacterium]
MSQANDTKNCTKDDTNVHKELTENQNVIIGLIAQDDTITRAILTQKTGLSDSTIARELKTLSSLGILHREGGRKKGRWVIENKK